MFIFIFPDTAVPFFRAFRPAPWGIWDLPSKSQWMPATGVCLESNRPARHYFSSLAIFHAVCRTVYYRILLGRFASGWISRSLVHSQCSFFLAVITDDAAVRPVSYAFNFLIFPWDAMNGFYRLTRVTSIDCITPFAIQTSKHFWNLFVNSTAARKSHMSFAVQLKPKIARNAPSLLSSLVHLHWCYHLSLLQTMLFQFSLLFTRSSRLCVKFWSCSTLETLRWARGFYMIVQPVRLSSRTFQNGSLVLTSLFSRSSIMNQAWPHCTWQKRADDCSRSFASLLQKCHSLSTVTKDHNGSHTNW